MSLTVCFVSLSEPTTRCFGIDYLASRSPELVSASCLCHRPTHHTSVGFRELDFLRPSGCSESPGSHLPSPDFLPLRFSFLSVGHDGSIVLLKVVSSISSKLYCFWEEFANVKIMITSLVTLLLLIYSGIAPFLILMCFSRILCISCRLSHLLYVIFPYRPQAPFYVCDICSNGLNLTFDFYLFESPSFFSWNSCL